MAQLLEVGQKVQGTVTTQIKVPPEMPTQQAARGSLDDSGGNGAGVAGAGGICKSSSKSRVQESD